MAWQRRALLLVLAISSLACTAEFGPRPYPQWGPEERELERRCQVGSWSTCGQLGRILLRAERTQRERERALVLLEAACGQEDVPSCVRLGLYYRHDHEGGGPARARDLLTWACQRQAAEACAALTPAEPTEPAEGQGI